MLKYNIVFVAQNLSGNVVAFMGERTLEGRPWIFKIPQDKPLPWHEIYFLRNLIEIQTHLSQEEILHDMWDTTGKTNLTTIKLPRLALVPYTVVEWIN